MGTAHRAVYAAFDLFPSAKGAATHISHMSQFLFDKYDGGLLLTLGDRPSLEQEIEGSVELKRFSRAIPHYLDRAQAFSQYVDETITALPNLHVAHFRDIWSGLGILQEANYKTLFEVNGLPSIELPYRYPAISSNTLKKIHDIETFCLEKSDTLVVPSLVIKKNIEKRGIAADKIHVVSNAASLPPSFANDIPLPEQYLLYFGAVQSWQGVDTLLKSFALLQDIEHLNLVICCSNKQKYTKNYQKLALKLGIADRIVWQYQISKSQLNTYIKHALLTVAPLAECSRNIEQGCSPLKIFESMACGTAVVASDLPVTREIIENNRNGKLVPPDRPQELSRAIRLLLEYPETRAKLAEAGYQSIATQYNWTCIKQQMFKIYEQWNH